MKLIESFRKDIMRSRVDLMWICIITFLNYYNIKIMALRGCEATSRRVYAPYTDLDTIALQHEFYLFPMHCFGDLSAQARIFYEGMHLNCRMITDIKRECIVIGGLPYHIYKYKKIRPLDWYKYSYTYRTDSLGIVHWGIDYSTINPVIRRDSPFS